MRSFFIFFWQKIETIRFNYRMLTKKSFLDIKSIEKR